MLPKNKVKLLLSILVGVSFQPGISEIYYIDSDDANYTSARDSNNNSGHTYVYGDRITITTTGSAYAGGAGIGYVSGIYINNKGNLTIGNDLTIDTSGDGADGLRSNPSGRTNWSDSIGEIRVGDNLSLTVRGISSDCVNMNGKSSAVIGDNARFYSEYTGAPTEDKAEGAHGLRANFESSITVGERGYVSVKGISAYGIYATSGTFLSGAKGSSVTMGDDATVLTYGQGGHAVYSASGSQSKIHFQGASIIGTTGNGANGVRVAAGTLIADGEITISTLGLGSDGLYNTGTTNLNGGAQISTLGDGADGIYFSGSSSNVNINGATQVNTSGLGSNGIYSNSGKLTSSSTLTVGTEGNGSHALYAKGGTITLNAVSSFTTSGDGSHGIYFDSNSATLAGSGAINITTSGEESHAISATNKANKTFTETSGVLSGNILVSGEGSAVLHATAGNSNNASSLTVGNSGSLNMSMTGVAAGVSTWGARADQYGTINFIANSNTGGTGLYATGSGSSAKGAVTLKDTANASGSRVRLDGYGVLDVTNITDTATIGSLESDSENTELLLSNKTIVIGQNNSANNGSMLAETEYAGKVTGITGSIFEKTGAGTKLFLTNHSGFTVDYVNVRGGMLSFASDGQFNILSDYATYAGGATEVGRNNSTLNVVGEFTQNSNSDLYVIIGSNPDITAQSAHLDGTVYIMGFTDATPTPVKASEATVEFYTVISTQDGITGDFINNPLTGTGMDYLLRHGYVSADGKNYCLGFELAWLKGCTPGGTGTFTVHDGTAFDIDIDLQDQVPDASHPWDGKTLTKKGDGLLVISSDATYTGNTIVEAGTLEVTGSIISHVDNSSILNAPGSIGSLQNNASGIARVGLVDGDVSNAGTLYLNMDTPEWGNLHNTGLLDFVNLGRTLTVENFSGSGVIRMDVDLNTGDADRIIATGDISGSQSFLFSNVGTGVDLRDRVEEIVTVLGTVNEGTSLTGTLEEGIYVYELLQQDDQTWDLVISDNYTEETQMIVNTVGSMSISWFSQLDSLLKRMGDLRMGASKSNDLWIRTYGQQVNGKMGIAGVGGLRQYDWGVDVGYDRSWTTSRNNTYVLGGFFGYQGAHRTTRDTFNTKGDTDSEYVGLYGTWLNKKGWYADVVVKGQYFDNDYTATSGNGSFHNYALGTSVELGRQFVSNKRWFVEPSIQVAHMHLFNSNHTSGSGLRVNTGDADVYRFSFMTRAGKTYHLKGASALQPYVKVGIEEQVSNGGGVRVNGVGFRPDTDGTRGIAGAGLIWQIRTSSQIHLDYEAAFGSKYTKPWSVNLGYRYQF